MDEKKKQANFVSIQQASLITGLSKHTLRTYADKQTVVCYKTPSGQRKFDSNFLQAMCHPSSGITQVTRADSKQHFIYARVSSKKQLDDLSRQVEVLRSYTGDRHDTFTLIQDVASGINFKRKGLQTILDSCLQGNIGTVVCAHRDRLCRFGFELVKYIVEKAGGKLIIIDDQRNKSTEQELSEDLLSIVHIYSCRQMGKRKYKYNKPTCNQVENLPNQLSETNI